MSDSTGTFVGLSSTQPTPVSPVNSFVHDSFPPGNTSSVCRSLSRNGRRQFVNKRIVAEDSFIMTGSRLVSDNEKSSNNRVNVLFPHLISDRTPKNNRKGPRCAFTDNQKSYLRMKGIKISDAYSLNRNNRTREQGHLRQEFEKRSLSDFDLPSLMNNSNTKEKVSDKETSKLWRPHNSRKVLTGNPMYARLIKGLENKARIPSHVRSDDVRVKRLGKVLTQQHVNEILNEEKPIIPKAFYTKL